MGLGQERKAFQVQTFDDLVKSDLPPTPCWIGPPAIVPKGGLVLFGGEPKIGKTWAALEFTRALATGTELFEQPDLPGEVAKVLYIDQELGPEALKERVVPAFKEDPQALANINYLTQRETVVDLSDPASREEIYGIIDQLKPNVVIFDPMEKMHSVDENNATEMGRMFKWFDVLRHDFQEQLLTVVMVHHYKKPPSDKSGYDPLSPHNFRGTGRWFNAPDAIVTFSRGHNISGVPIEAWHLTARYMLRRSASPGDIRLTMNAEQDFRMRYTGKVDSEPVTAPDLGPKDEPEGGGDGKRKLFIAS
jgi:KaiC/GvpD/RAD55 family RecA-like ATPase